MRTAALAVTAAWCVLAFSSVIAETSAPSTQAVPPAALVWYRGVPAGTPRQNDLAVIRANGFSGIVWPEAHASAVPTLARMARIVDLVVHTRAAPRPLTGDSALKPGPVADVSVAGGDAPIASALAWRAIAHGARQIAYDSGDASGNGVAGADGRPHAWVADAAALSRQFTFNARLFEALRGGPSIAFEGTKPAGLDVALLDGSRSWVLIATNASRETVDAIVRLPAGVPPALWLELLDGTHISMLNQREGPRWTLSLPAGAARVYIVDKVPGGPDLQVRPAPAGPEGPAHHQAGYLPPSS